MSEKKQAEFREPSKSWATKDIDSKYVEHMGMSGRISVASLLAHMATIAPGVKPDQMMLNFATVRWERDATAEERGERVAQQARQAASREAWERRTLDELIAKHGVPEQHLSMEARTT